MFTLARTAVIPFSTRPWVLTLQQTLWGTFLLFLCSQINIPLKPVPITMQTFGILLIGLNFAPKPALLAMVLYLFLGACGLPMFAEFSSGYERLIGPTAGYFLGFLLATIFMTHYRQYFQERKLTHTIINCLCGSALIYIFGIGWLCKLMPLQTALAVGFYPFILPGVLKIGLLTLAMRYLNSEPQRKF